MRSKRTRLIISRRDFLKLAGLSALAAGCGLRRQPTSTPISFGTPNVEITLTSQTVDWELAPGKVITAWTYNGKVPGEAIHVREGDRVRITLKNDLPEPTTIHWHGIDVPTDMDGVPDISQPAVQPGEMFIYEFEARPAGTRWYHTHFNSAQQMDLGLSAPFIIEPAAGEMDVDREYTLMLDDWVTGSGATTASGESGMGGMMGNDGMMGGSSGDGMMGLVGDTGPAYDTFTINGKAYPATDSLSVKQGDRVRLRLINASNMQTFVIALADHHLQVTHTDGNPLQTPVEVDAVPIAPAERYDVIVTADNPGKWALQALDAAHREGGLKIMVAYRGFESATESAETQRDLTLWSYALGQGLDTLPPASDRLSLALTLSGGMAMMGQRPDEWTINGKVYPDTDSLSAARDQLISAQLFNMSMQAHPFHLHGQSFRVVSVGGQRLSTPLIKDTVDVPAMMGSVEIEFAAFNPGDWMFHCHKPMHMDGGMAMIVNIA